MKRLFLVLIVVVFFISFLGGCDKKGESNVKKVMDPQELSKMIQGAKKYSLTISMKADVDPVNRYEQFEEPLAKALGEVGQIDGGGSMLGQVDGKNVIVQCDIEVSVDDVEKALPIIKKVLKEAKAPQETQIIVHDPKEAVYSLY